MFSLFQEKKRVGFFDGKTFRFACVGIIDGKSVLSEEKAFLLESDESLTAVFAEIKKSFGNKIRLIVSEDGVYTFSVKVASKNISKREDIERSVQEHFPEDVERTAWDYRILSKNDQEALLEITELKQSWYDKITEAAASTGMTFESIVPESVAFAKLIPENDSAVLLIQREEKGLLVASSSNGNILSSFFFRVFPLISDVNALIEFFKKKDAIEIKKVYFSGIDAEMLKEIPLEKIDLGVDIDPILGEGMANHWIRDEKDLNLAPSMPKQKWYKKTTMKKQENKREKSVPAGFTLLEILIVVGIIAILATIIIVTLDPAERFRNAREARRLSDIQTVSNAVHQYLIDKKGIYPPGINERERQIGQATSGCQISAGACNVTGSTDCINLSDSLNPYISSIPEDPEGGSKEYTHYTIEREKDGNRIIVRSCDSTEEYVIQ